MVRRVHIATPTTLVTMLRTAQYAWQQEALSQNARAVFDLGRELHARIAGLGRNMDTLGRTLTKAVTAYNQTVGSLESRVLVSARRLSQLGVVDSELPCPAPVEEVARGLSAPELVERRSRAARPGDAARIRTGHGIARYLRPGSAHRGVTMDLRPAWLAVSWSEVAPRREGEAQACPTTRGKVRRGRDRARPSPRQTQRGGPARAAHPPCRVRAGRMTPGAG